MSMAGRRRIFCFTTSDFVDNLRLSLLLKMLENLSLSASPTLNFADSVRFSYFPYAPPNFGLCRQAHTLDFPRFCRHCQPLYILFIQLAGRLRVFDSRPRWILPTVSASLDSRHENGGSFRACVFNVRFCPQCHVLCTPPHGDGGASGFLRPKVGLPTV